MSKHWLLAIGLLGAAQYCYAEEEILEAADIDVPSPWDTEVEFGYQSHTGNSDSRSMNTRLAAAYTAGRNRSSGELTYYLLYKDGEEDKRQSSYALQSDYKLGPKTYLYGSFKGFDSLYSAYFRDYTLSAGMGYQFSNTDLWVFEMEAGPGFRYQEPNLDEIDDDDIIFPNTVQEAIFRGNVTTHWQALDNLSIDASLTIVSGKSNTSTDTDISVITNVTEDIAIKLSHSRQAHNRVPEGLEKADSIFSINLLFAF